MKTKITTAFLTLVTAFAFAQEAIVSPVETIPAFQPKLPKLEEKVSSKKSFGYLRMGVSDSQLPSADMKVLPGVGLGYRLAAGSSAFDFSASFNGRETRIEESKERTYVYTLPKANYLYYISSSKNNSLYAGGGMAWGGVKTKEQDEFHGLIPNVTVGYEMNRNATLRTFLQIDVSQPALAAIQQGSLPKAFAEVSLGAGF
jgi:hypothetical protein